MRDKLICHSANEIQILINRVDIDDIFFKAK